MTHAQAVAAALDSVEGRTGWHVLQAPAFPTVEEVIDWLEARGAGEPRLWFGPDGLVRGFGVCRA